MSIFFFFEVFLEKNQLFVKYANKNGTIYKFRNLYNIFEIYLR